MSRPVKDDAKRPRLQIPVTLRQRQMIIRAARLANSHPNTWALAQVMCAAAPDGRSPADVPVILSQPVSARVRERARAQEITPDELVKQLLMLGRGAP